MRCLPLRFPALIHTVLTVMMLPVIFCAAPSTQAQQSTQTAAQLNAQTTTQQSMQPGAIRITADLTDAPRKLYHAEIDLPVKSGPLTLTTAQWIPGRHRPEGPAEQISGVVFTANGQTLPWRRDDIDLYAFHLTIPPAVTTLHAHIDCIVTARISQQLAVLEWEKLLLYPAHTPVREIAIEPSVKVPAGWSIGTSLVPTSASAYPLPTPGSTTHFAPTNVEQLEDSPLITGIHFREFPLAPDVSPKHFIDVVAEQPEDANLRPNVLAALGNVVHEAGALYGSHHYSVYHFLLTISDVAGGEGLEHGQSSDNGVEENGLADDAHLLGNADLLPHEFSHSWNGKYRRPVGLYQPDFATPQQGALLWVYEGMTQYLGNVLAVRSGMESPAQFRDMLALAAAQEDARRGRKWRSTGDTAIASSVLRNSDPAWLNWRRVQDYYRDGELIWLDVDTLIRKQTHNTKSLDDFQRRFLGKDGDTGPTVVPYTLDELVTELNAVAPYDWATFFSDHVDRINPQADFDGIERGGYKLVYRAEPNNAETLLGSVSRRSGGPDCWYSLGVYLSGDGTISDVQWQSAADKARLAPGYKILAVNGRIYSADALLAAIRVAKGNSEPIHLIVQADSFVSIINVDYHDGLRYPALERIEGSSAYLDEIIKPLTKIKSATASPNGSASSALSTSPTSPK